MGETRHTPGPWKTGDHDWHTIVGPETRFLTDGEGGRHLSAVAVVDRSDDPDEDAMNARLIVAAPTLLLALRQLLTVSLPKDVSGERFVAFAREAVALATGRP